MVTLREIDNLTMKYLSTHPGNWRSHVYGKNDPVNFVDPSGYYSQELQSILNEIWGRNEPQRAMNAIKDAVKTAGYNSGAGVAVGALTVAGPPLLAAVAPKVVGLTLAATIEYNAAMIGAGQYIARNPQKIEAFINNSIDFIDNFSGALGGMTTGTVPETLGGHAGVLLGAGINEMQNNYDSSSQSFSDSFYDSWWNQ